MRPLIVLCAALAAACVQPKYPCSKDADCPARTVCDSSGHCAIPGGCEKICAANEACDSTSKQCVAVAPAVGTITVPTTWSKRSQNVTVTAVIDGTGTQGVASATLQIANQPDIAGTTSDTGLIRTYTFVVPGSVQAAGSEKPVDFTVIGTDTAGHSTPTAAQGHGQLLIDDAGPVVQGVTINGGAPDASGIKWFAASQTGNIDAQVGIVDAGSGVDPATLTLTWTGGRLDTGTPSCGPGQSAQALICHFAIPPSTVPAGSQQLIQFAVAGADKAGNPVKANSAAVGIDGKAPSLTFNIVTFSTASLPPGASGYYPAPGSNCNGGVADSALYCGHDGNHYYRHGETNPIVLIATDTGGSGVTATTISYSIAGSSTCTVAAPCSVTDAGGGNFSFVPDFSTATFTSGTDGTGTISVTVTAKDIVGNMATPTPLTVNVTRVKWMRQLSAVNNLAGAPVLSPGNNLLIVAGNSPTTDPIVSVKTDGAVGTFKFGAGKFTTVTTNMALDTTPSTDPSHPTPVLYVNAGPNVYAVTTADATQYCTNVLSTSDTAGSPVIFGGGATADVIVTAGNAVGAFTTSFTAGHTCPPHGSMSFSNPSPPPPSSQPTLGPPSADGSTVFFGYDNNTFTTGDRGLKSVHFAGGTFDTANTVNIGKLPTNSSGPAPIALSSDLFFGNDFNHQFYDYTTALTLSHTSPTLTAAIFASPVISGGLVFGASDQLLAFNKSDISTTAWTAVSGGTQVTPPAIGVDTLYVSAAANKLIHAIDAVTGTTTRSDRWTYGGSGATTPVTTLSSVTTEPTLAADGTLYFGDSGGKVYALITDTVPATTGAGDWPRTGFDNCNSNHSNNTGFSCQ